MKRSRPDFWTTIEPELAWIHRQLRRLGVREADVEDLAQEVCLRVFRVWAEWDARRSVQPWLFGFIIRVAADYRRRAHNRKPHESGAAELPDEGASPELHAEAERERAAVLDALDALTDGQREAVILVELEQYTVSEAATILGVSESTLRERAAKGRRQLVVELGRMLSRRRPS